MASSLRSDADMANASFYDSFRKAYSHKDFSREDLQCREPVGQFDVWFKLACDTKMEVEPNAVALATSTSSGIVELLCRAYREGRPSLRYVLLKGYDTHGFRFFTNYNSRKGQELTSNPFASMTFYWPVLHRQIRIDGLVRKLSEKQSSQYFHSRPRDSQIGACVSRQSEVIPNRQILVERRQQLLETYQDPSSVIPKPHEWGGFLLVPEAVEFWQGHSDRLHDRLKYQRVQPLELPLQDDVSTSDSEWIIQRLSP